MGKNIASPSFLVLCSAKGETIMKQLLSLAIVSFFISLTGMEPPLEKSKEDLNQQLAHAALDGDYPKVKSLLEQGADPSATPTLLCEVINKGFMWSRKD